LENNPATGGIKTNRAQTYADNPPWLKGGAVWSCSEFDTGCYQSPFTAFDFADINSLLF
jgi:hypothetical protein